MSSSFRRFNRNQWYEHPEDLMVVFNDGERVIVKDQDGLVAIDCSRWLFEMCWKRGWFYD